MGFLAACQVEGLRRKGESAAIAETPRQCFNSKQKTEETMMILHHGWRSSASRRVRLCLEEKGLAYEGHVVDMAKLEHHSPEYLKINPLGVGGPDRE